jgi:hypothetical protein
VIRPWILEPVLQSGENDVPDSVLFPVLPIFVLVVGGLFWYADAKRPVLRARQFLGMQSFDPRDDGVSTHDEDGLIAIRGAVKPLGDSVTAPLSGSDCVVYERADQAYHYSYKYDRAERRRLKRKGIDEDLIDRHGWSWDTTDSEHDGVPFHVETEHGPVAVDPEEAKTELPEKIDRSPSVFYRLVYMAHPFTGRARSIFGLLMRLPGTGYLTPSRPTRQVERRLEAGEDVLVVADAGGVETTDGDVVGSVADGAEVDRFRITTRSRRSLVLRSIGGAIRSSTVGIVTLLLAAVIVVVGVVTGAY